MNCFDCKTVDAKAVTMRRNCICGMDHDEITPEQVIAAEMRGPLATRERDPFPDLPGNSTVNFSTPWSRGGVFLDDEAAARCSTPEELNRMETRLEGELLRHVKAGLRTAGLSVPGWANGMPVVTEATPGRPVGRPRKTRKMETVLRRLTAAQRMERAANAARARAAKAAKRAAILPS